ncbi:MAG: GNAT family N-acetyltransferase [Verrucomicrobia bacterium]|nr:GNAT family N-acetyltransferase [Verrucomicrobiota bacterium]
MSSPLKLRVMTQWDIEFADHLREMANWNQTPDDWRRFLAMEPEGCFVAEWDGIPVGTVTTTTYGADLAWIGMMLVHPDYRGKGIGRALMEQALNYLKNRNIACIKLDATPMGQPVYEKLGFKPEWTLRRWETRRVNLPAKPMRYRVNDFRYPDMVAVTSMDLSAFGAPRWNRLMRLRCDASRAVVHRSPKGRVTGFGFVRNGMRAIYLGPVVAESFPAAGALIKTLVRPLTECAIFWDIPDFNVGAIELAQRLGFLPQRTLTRMFLGKNSNPGRPEMIFGIAAPEVG